MVRACERAAALLLILLATSCGDGRTPTGPDDRISGVWMAHVTLTSVSGGACVGSALQSSVGNRDIVAALISQTGSRLTASFNSEGNQTSCSYSGTASGASVSLSLSSCQAGRVSGFQCPDGTRYDLQMVTDRITAQAVSAGPGASTSTWNVMASGSTAPIGVLTVNAEFVWNQLGIPHSDFHVFDGSVRPGYVDGVVVIPQEVNPFCDECGWF